MASKFLWDFNKVSQSIKSAKIDWRKSISIILSMILLIMILQNIIGTAYFFLPQRDKFNTVPPAVNTQMKKVSYKDISRWHLLGIAGINNLAVTQLSLKLTGILIDEGSKEAKAIIVTPDGKEKIYKVGDVLSGGARIYLISPREVIIQYMSRMERLPLKASQVNNVPSNNLPDNSAISTPTGTGSDDINPQINNYMNLLKRFKNLGQ